MKVIALSVVVVASLLIGCTTNGTRARALEVLADSGAILDSEDDRVSYSGLSLTRLGNAITMSFSYDIWGRNHSQIDQLLVSVNGHVVEFVVHGLVRDGIQGSANVEFDVTKYATGPFTIEIGLTAAISKVRAQQHYETEKGGHRLVVARGQTK